jgi:hypothetical protein
MSNKKMNSNDIVNLAKKEFAYKVITVTTNEGSEFEIEIQPKLNETKIMQLISDLVERSEYCSNNKIHFDEVFNTYFLLLKYFTTIKFNTYKVLKKQYQHELDTVDALYDLGVLDQIWEHFDAESMEQLEISLNKYTKQMKVLTNNRLKEMISEELEERLEQDKLEEEERKAIMEVEKQEEIEIKNIGE